MLHRAFHIWPMEMMSKSSCLRQLLSDPHGTSDFMGIPMVLPISWTLKSEENQHISQLKRKSNELQLKTHKCFKPPIQA